MFEPHSSEGGRYWGPFGTTGIPGARVTIIGGQVDGWTAVTDREGRFTWQDYPECALDSAECRARRFRVEAAGYVTVEEGASDPHMFWGPLSPEYSTSEKHIPMSVEWPADPQIQRMLRELPAMSPLWLVERRERHGAGYVAGIIWTSRLEWSTMLAHEYCHAHQDWASDPDTYGLDDRRWAQSPEGTAYREAYAVDRLTNDPWFRTDENQLARLGRVRRKHLQPPTLLVRREEPTVHPGASPQPVCVGEGVAAAPLTGYAAAAIMPARVGGVE